MKKLERKSENVLEVGTETETDSNMLQNVPEKNWKRNSFLKMILYIIFFISTIVVVCALEIGCIAYSYGFYGFDHKDAVQALCEETGYRYSLQLADYLTSQFYDTAGTADGIVYDSADISTVIDSYTIRHSVLADLDAWYDSNIGKEYYGYSITLTNNTWDEVVVSNQTYDEEADIIYADETYHTIEFPVNVCVFRNTYDSYGAAEAARNSFISYYNYDYDVDQEVEINDEIYVPDNASVEGGIYPIEEDGYLLEIISTRWLEIDITVDSVITSDYLNETGNYGLLLKQELQIMDTLYDARYHIWVIGGIAGILAVLSFFLLLAAAGHSRKKAGICETWFEKIPLEIILACCVFAGMGIVGWKEEFNYVFYYQIIWYILQDVIMAVWMLGLIWVSTFLIRTIVVRVKAKHLLHSSLIWRYGKRLFGKESKLRGACRYLSRKIPFVWKALLIYAVITIIEIFFLLCFLSDGEALVLLYCVEKVLVTLVLILIVVWLHELKKGGEKLAEGDMEYQINTQNMYGAFKAHGENLNHLNDGLKRAVEECMKSERMKTELITNVSHDIKTPLTSIINYVDLLQKENIVKEPEASYIDVLARQSARLKKLIEDLVEASKASTGNVNVDLKPMDANMVLAQAAAEYVDRLEEKQLQLVTIPSETGAMILADGRHLWRIFDNLLNNAYKYAMQGTRVYVQIVVIENNVQIVFKNISREQLNISSDELLERFVRGDSSRNTEGSGLGLSIARSLCQLMHADFQIEIDGDLYKAIITFPTANLEESE